ncbi:predicted protein [Pyrenophora tritici-repentis Pt-1C-BFP]|uniref:Uncharacterized protein n=1 Tax=Pyrenophora tritici-repentis (strain Pt-1C-BFP) TaxID=426418 RepID=B2W2Y3_PYRTR|nr:uncharacterized protein PTRG_03781 [Pyrenophora tritici-repentis Pt-1C-BFP]EDU46619.1 predicted protein [Pyrenophora tritici-repentis Pt-1C-BFP]
MSNCCSTSFSCDPCAGFGGARKEYELQLQSHHLFQRVVKCAALVEVESSSIAPTILSTSVKLANFTFAILLSIVFIACPELLVHHCKIVPANLTPIVVLKILTMRLTILLSTIFIGLAVAAGTPTKPEKPN